RLPVELPCLLHVVDGEAAEGLGVGEHAQLLSSGEAFLANGARVVMTVGEGESQRFPPWDHENRARSRNRAARGLSAICGASGLALKAGGRVPITSKRRGRVARGQREPQCPDGATSQCIRHE